MRPGGHKLDPSNLALEDVYHADARVDICAMTHPLASL